MSISKKQIESDIRRIVPREASGQYAVRDLRKICECGHGLGEHTAARVAGTQECLSDGCPCMLFKKVRSR